MPFFTDTLHFELAKDTLQLAVNMSIDNIPKVDTDTPFNKEWIPVIGMTLVAFITVLSQYYLTNRTTKAEFEKIQAQINSDFSAKSRFEWINNFRHIISELLTTVDPDFRGELDEKKMANLIFQGQLMLDDTIAHEKHISSILSKLGDYAVKVEIGNKLSERELLLVQAELEKATKEILKDKQLK